jgi:S1-C subfamily serine protease
MKSIKTIILLFVGIVFMTNIVLSQKPTPSSYDNSLVEVIAKCEKAVFLIECYDTIFNYAAVQGTGFFIDTTGMAVTNFHVLCDYMKYKVRITTYDNKVYDIDRIINYNEDADILKFKVAKPEDSSFSCLQLSGDGILKGTQIMVIGNPNGFVNTISTGIVSGLREKQYGEEVQISAAISHGSSGGPVIDLNNGAVIGIVKASYTDGQNLNFSININSLKNLDDELELSIEEEKFLDLYVKGIDAYDDGDYRRALDVMTQAIKLKPASALAIYYRGLIKDELSMGSALDDMKKAAELGNDNAKYFVEIRTVIKKKMKKIGF